MANPAYFEGRLTLTLEELRAIQEALSHYSSHLLMDHPLNKKFRTAAVMVDAEILKRVGGVQ